VPIRPTTLPPPTTPEELGERCAGAGGPGGGNEGGPGASRARGGAGAHGGRHAGAVLRRSIRISVHHLEAWLRGRGIAPHRERVEDSAAVDASRSVARRWIHGGVVLDDGEPLTPERFRAMLSEEMERVRLEVGEARFDSGRFEDARALFERLSTEPDPVAPTTPSARERLAAGQEERGMTASGSSPSNPHHPDPRRWEGIARRYSKGDVEKLRGSVKIEHTLARLGAERLWDLLHTEPYLPALGALTGGQAVQMVRAGLKAIYLSGWQVAADANTAGQTYPDQSLYPADSVPTVVRRINSAFQRADQIEHAEGRNGTHWFAPIVADAEAGFGGPLNAFELMKAMIEAGAAGVHFEDQVASEKKCGHLGGKVLVPTSTFVRTLTAARLAADVLDVPTLVVARTDAESASLIMSDVDPHDAPFVDRSTRTAEGFFRFKGGIEAAVARGLAYAPYADMVWCETQTPDLEFARKFAEAIHAEHPGKLLAYNCSPSFNWKKHLDDETIARFQRELGAMGYKFQFVTLAGFHALNHSMFQLASGYRERGMAAYSELQQGEFGAEKHGYTATRHQREVGVGYFDAVATAISAGESSTLALEGSTEAAQFTAAAAAGRNGTTHAASQIQAALDEDHGRLEAMIGRLEAAHDGMALAASLEELVRTLTEHFAHEEHSKGFYGLLGARSPQHRAELDRMVQEHRDILAALKGIAESTKGANAPEDVMRRTGELAARLLDHESREMKLAHALA
jgi:isocitrate lyase/hemerythrin